MIAWLRRRLRDVMDSDMGFRGELSARVTRANPTRMQRVMDYLRGLA